MNKEQFDSINAKLENLTKKCGVKGVDKEKRFYALGLCLGYINGLKDAGVRMYNRSTDNIVQVDAKEVE